MIKNYFWPLKVQNLMTLIQYSSIVTKVQLLNQKSIVNITEYQDSKEKRNILYPSCIGKGKRMGQGRGEKKGGKAGQEGP